MKHMMVKVLGAAVVGMVLGGAGLVSPARAATTVQGGGASFPAPIYKRWAQDFEAKSGTHVEYNSQGSGAGILGVTQKTLDFAGSDAPMSKTEKAALGSDEVLQLPAVAGAVVLTYNLPEVKGEIKLTGEVIAEIFLGKITKWNDAKISGLNAGMELPATPITPVYRSDGSGTTFVFTSYLATQSVDFVKQSPPGKNVTINGGQAGKGNEGVSNQVKKIPGAIGYVELTYALNEKLAFAAVKNKAGSFVTASPASVSAAGVGAEGKMKGTSLTANIWNGEAAEAYPISSFTYLLVRKDLSYLKDSAKAQGVVDFIKYGITTGQGNAEGLSYAAVPEAIRSKALDALASVVFEGKALESK